MKTKYVKSQLLYKLKKANIFTEYLNKEEDNEIECFEILCSFKISTGQTIKHFILIEDNEIYLLVYHLGACYNAKESIIKCNEVNTLFSLVCTYINFTAMAKIVCRSYFSNFYDFYKDTMEINLDLLSGECKNSLQSLLNSL